ncbi:hypothetical protein [Pseudomonas sp. BBP2017]|uniref:hypothetical protein n=1 Tax=Pseudomonas sp. BBP2017 TaxID=2109731 RepID=UPI000D12419D|nr:hypothetical protein [Pseudomonas sp. BBP2017]PSS58845.1 hypothetical protein C6382_00170 [Pseudomonas sp. BBP2017]
MSTDNQEQHSAEKEEINKAGAAIAGGMAAINFAVLIQLLPELKSLNSWPLFTLWLSLLALSVSVPVLTFVFGCYSVIPRPGDARHIPIKCILYWFCIISGVSISLAIAAFHPLAGISFLITCFIALKAENTLEQKANTSTASVQESKTAQTAQDQRQQEER